MKTTKQYPTRVQRNLDLIEDAFHDSDKGIQPEIRLLVAALRSLDFCVLRAMAGYPDISWARSGTPNVDIESPFVPYILGKYTQLPDDWWVKGTPEYRVLRAQIRKATLEAKIELLKLIEEFYRERRSSPNVLLTFDIETGSRFRLRCRGDLNAASLGEVEYIEWLRAAQAEMQAFAEFLCTNVKA